MTHLEANVKNFSLSLDDQRRPAYFVFQFGLCEDFAEALTRLKKRVPAKERDYDGDKTWRVRATPANETRLRAIFDNFQEALDNARLQAVLF